MTAVLLVATNARAQTKPVLQAAPAAPGQGQAAAAPAVVGSLQGSYLLGPSYIIGPNDVLQVTVRKEPDVSLPSVPVRPDGKISVPMVGDIVAAGVTPTALAANIAEALRKYLTDPLVTVGLVSVYPKEISIIGEVAHPGPIALIPGMTVLQALAAAGGLTPYANKKLVIQRTSGGKTQLIPFDYKKAFRKGDQQGVVLQPGDTITIY